ncbi:methyltransferase domain-containing protein [Streptomyces sp. NPDC051180]|uniref:class I SAM-dependent methyltransferase n=1 Tax=unclassified Streptomyces TaxID=2593676 RepID=UPI00344ED71E
MTRNRVYDDERLAGAYQRGNEMPEASLRDWTRLIGSFTDRPAPAIVEVGAGTGMFCAAAARWLAPSTVVGVDPSAAMLAEAVRHHDRPAVHYLRGDAEALPVRSGAFDLALLSRVIHHLPDRPRVAGELARVLRPGGVVVVRTTFRDRLDALVYDYWPKLRELDRTRFPSADEIREDFASAGFTVRKVTSFARPVAVDLRTYHARLTARPQSKFGRLSPAEFEDGLDHLAADARREGATGPVPVDERYDLMVLTAP